LKVNLGFIFSAVSWVSFLPPSRAVYVGITLHLSPLMGMVSTYIARSPCC